MAEPTEPPKGILASGTVTALAGGTYHAASKGFTYQGTNYLLTVQRQSGNAACVEWTHSTTNEAKTYNNPQAEMSSNTWDVVHNGSYDPQGGTYSYNNTSYEIRVEESGSGLQAVAIAVQ